MHFEFTLCIFFLHISKKVVILQLICKGKKRMPFADYKYHTDSTLRPSLLWEYDLSAFDWQTMRDVVVQRVLGRGRRDDYYAMLNMYGLDGVREALRNVPYMNDKDMNFACHTFNLKKEDLKCYKRKQSRQQHFNS